MAWRSAHVSACVFLLCLGVGLVGVAQAGDDSENPSGADSATGTPSTRADGDGEDVAGTSGGSDTQGAPGSTPAPEALRLEELLGLVSEAAEILVADSLLTPEQAGAVLQLVEDLDLGDVGIDLTYGVVLVVGPDGLAQLVQQVADLVAERQADWEALAQEWVVAAVELDWVTADGEVVTGAVPPADPALSPELEELLVLAAELSEPVIAGDMSMEQATVRWLARAVQLGVIDDTGTLVLEVVAGSSLPPEMVELLALTQRLAERAVVGELGLEEAAIAWLGAVVDLGVIGAPGDVIVLPRPEPDPNPKYVPTPEELAMVDLLEDLARQIEDGEVSRDAAWERLTAAAGEMGWDLDEIDRPTGGEPQDPEKDTPAADDELWAITSNLATQVAGEDLSGEEAWAQLNAAFETRGLLDTSEDGKEGTAIESSSWGAIKASVQQEF